MRIAFVTSCLEPGRDGVGDYTRLLAQECVRQGWDCCLISLNDKFLAQQVESTIQVDNTTISLLRLPAVLSWKDRIQGAKQLLGRFQPDWVSLQFVPYGFQAKGIVYGLDHWLRKLTQDHKLHIMFHELWIGENQGASVKDQVIGTVQKLFVLRLVRQLKPQVVHTSNETYVAILKHCGIQATCLPMFGAIPITQDNGDDWLFPELRKLGLDISTQNREQFWLFGFFGALHPVWPPEPLLTYLQQASAQHQRRIALISIGRIGPGEGVWNTFSKRYSEQFTFLQLGERAPDKISEFFNSIDFGVATSPWSLIGKSASVAAMLEHGLPVIVNRDEIKFQASLQLMQKNDQLLYKMSTELLNEIKILRRRSAQSKVATTATKLLKSLGTSEKSLLLSNIMYL